MTVVFCIDDNPRYLMLLRAALRSLRAVMPEARRVCVYAGTDPAITSAVAAEGAELARYTPVLGPEKIPLRFHRCIGCFLKLELALVPELADETTVLYCDSDVLFLRSPTPLFALEPAYMAMAREATAPFWHEHEQLDYAWRGRHYTVPMPFPIWTFSSGVVLFNLERLRRHDHIRNFLAFCEQNVERIGNLDQSLLNYFFGKRITRLDGVWNRPPYHADALSQGRILHFHGPKPWDTRTRLWNELRINDFARARERWLNLLDEGERAVVAAWEAGS